MSFLVGRSELDLKRQKLKKLLHHRRKLKALRDFNNEKKIDSKLHLRYVTDVDIKKYNKDFALNRIRRYNAKNELNKFEHAGSKHIRFKPYYDSEMPVHWIGIVSDITIPKKRDLLEGTILIDKVSTQNNKEILDYHAWLKITDIKMLEHRDRQKIGIGDYIEGISYITAYGKRKYGLSTTIILSAGIYSGKNRADKMISNYSRGDDWVLDIENSNASLRAKKAYLNNSKSIKHIKEIAGHVTCRYQPSRYSKYQDRLVTNDKNSTEKPLRIISESLNPYFSIVQKVFVKRIIEDEEYDYKPMIKTGPVFNEYGRLVASELDVEYSKKILSIGIVEEKQKIGFIARSSENNQISIIDAKVLTNKLIPKGPNILDVFTGYLLYRDKKQLSSAVKTEKGKKYIESFMEWTRNKQLDPATVFQSTKKAWSANKQYSSLDVSKFLHIPQGWIDNIISQNILVPIKKTKTKFAGSELDKVYQVMNANDDFLAKEINVRFGFYRAKDIAQIVGLSEEKVTNIIIGTPYKSLNKFYGKLVLDIVKAKIKEEENAKVRKSQKRDELLRKFASNKSGIKRKHSTFEGKEKYLENREIKQLSLLDELNTQKKGEEHLTHAELKLQNINYNPYVIFKDKETANFFKAKTSKIKTNDKFVEKPQKQKIIFKTVLVTPTGEYTTEQFETFEAAKDYIESPLSFNEMNRFISCTNNITGDKKDISIRSILEWAIKQN